MKTIYYTSDLKWFNHAGGKYESKHHALRAHVEYALNSKDCKLYDGDKNRILERAKIADKRVNSNIAFSFNTALPNDVDLAQVKQWIEDIKDILATLLDMKKEDILVVFHDGKGVAERGNKHLHIIGVNLRADDKALVVNKHTLRALHQSLQQLILKRGYVIKKDTEEFKLPHLGPRLHYDDGLKKAYLEHLEVKEAYEQIYRDMQEKKKQEETRRLQAKKEEVLRAMEKNLHDVKTSYVRFEKRLTTGKQKFNRFFEVSHNAMELVKKANTNNELRQIVLSYNQEAKQIFDLIDMVNKEIEKRQARQQTKQQEQKPSLPPQQATPKQEIKQGIKPQPITTPKPAEPPKQATPEQKPTQPKPQEPIKKPQETAQSKPQEPAKKQETQPKIQPKPQPKQEEKVEKPKVETQAQQIETPKIETSKEPEKIETKPAEPERYILLYEVEEDADWYWENYVVNDIGENTNAETYLLPERLTEQHIDRLKSIAEKGHTIDILISHEEYYYENYDLLDKIKDIVNIMVIEEPRKQGQKKKQEDRGNDYGTPMGPMM